MLLTAWKEEFEGKKIVLWGFGMEGKGSLALIRKVCPKLPVTIADGDGKDLTNLCKDPYVTCVHQSDCEFASYDMVIKSPGIVIPHGMKKENITSQAQLFLKHYADRTIGITGTKGKSTTTSLVYTILKEERTVELVGNIGRSCFDAVEEMEKGDCLAAFEISCHQLENSTYSPHIGVYLNLYEEHLDHYDSFTAYGNAKANVFLNQKEGDVAILSQELTQYIPRSVNKPVLIGKDIRAEGKTLIIPGHTLDASKSSLIGSHNYQNLAVAYYIASLYGISEEHILHAIEAFSPLHHRLEELGIFGGIRYVNDSISTIGQACIQALKALDHVGTVLVGGMDRGIEYNELEEYLHERNDVNVVFMYASGHRVYNEMKEKNLLRKGLYVCEDLEEAMKQAKEITKQGDTILLSPAASSYDHFKNFEERGSVFKMLAEENI